MLTTFDADEHVVEALRAGATGFLLKSMPRDQFVPPVRAAVSGDSLLAPTLLRRLLDDFVRRAGATSATVHGDRRAHRRGRTRCCGWWRGGSPTPRSPSELVLGEGTVKTHVAHVLAKLGVRDRVQAVVAAYESGLVRPGVDGVHGAETLLRLHQTAGEATREPAECSWRSWVLSTLPLGLRGSAPTIEYSRGFL